MTDKEYEIAFKNDECCQNCTQFTLGMHFDGCPQGWCYQGGWELHYRDDVCAKYKRRTNESEVQNENNT